MKQKKKIDKSLPIYLLLITPDWKGKKKKRETYIRLNDNSIKTDGNHQSSNRVWGETGNETTTWFYLLFFFLSCVCVCALLSFSLSISTCVSVYIASISPFFCVLCLLCACLLFVPLLLYANVSRAWWGVILFALGSDIYRHVSIKDTSPRGYIVPLSSPGSFVLIGPSPNPHSQSPNTQQQPEIYIN